ncbi:retinol-binding protein pinta-like [Ostrinia furnacalis]|uniref:retinol-binding protein pinta-like n=1 Tax=Ostrinia furnacalis TaxID=93504 RepID=UPI0010409B90|nr:retinol-binding protein pinta-like [Ostrinia furnacalis]
MEVISKHPLIKVTAEDVRSTRGFYDLNDVKRINESLDVIEEWLKKQDHLVEASKFLNRSFLERVFILARGSIEGTKTKLDKLFTSRGLMPEMCLNKTVKEFEKLWNCVNYVPLPKLCPSDQSRVMVTQFLTDKLDDFSLLSYFRFSFMIGEYRLHYDYSLSERYIIDLTNLNQMTVLTKINPIVVRKAEILCSEGYGTKIKGIHLLNAPSYVDKLVSLLKQALKPKVAGRLHVHNTYEDLHKHIPKEILPKEYGGDETSCEKLSEQWKEVLRSEEATRIISQSDKLVSDESKRQSAAFNEEYLGMPGSFRKLNVD